MAKRIQCETFITTGLGDYVCPPSGISILYNNIRARKTLEYIQVAATHGYDPAKPHKQTLHHTGGSANIPSPKTAK